MHSHLHLFGFWKKANGGRDKDDRWGDCAHNESILDARGRAGRCCSVHYENDGDNHHRDNDQSEKSLRRQ